MQWYLPANFCNSPAAGKDMYVTQLFLNILQTSQTILLSETADVSWALKRMSSGIIQVSRLTACHETLQEPNGQLPSQCYSAVDLLAKAS